MNAQTLNHQILVDTHITPTHLHILAQDLSKYKSMNTTQVDAALKASTYLTKWVD